MCWSLENARDHEPPTVRGRGYENITPVPEKPKRTRTKREPFTPVRKAVFINVTQRGDMLINDDDLPLTRDVARQYKRDGEKIAKYEFVGYVR